MNPEPWAEVDRYLVEKLMLADPILDAALAASAAAGLPAINVAPNQGKFLQLLARINGSRRILEVGTLGGYSTIWLARALPNSGRLVTLELDPKHAEVAEKNFEQAGLADRIDLHVGLAADTLNQLIAEKTEPFDFIFIDADKASIPIYFTAALKLSHLGSVIVVDNVVRNGAVADTASTDENVQGVQRFLKMAADEPRVDATAVQTVGSKGYDGFALLRVMG
jgi:predicted O-methyltransferase YrrM|uniref:O-methyltransferase n=1 Tax=Cephaloticoccus sp. TaxID=1985742 RepID=UPI004049C728